MLIRRKTRLSRLRRVNNNTECLCSPLKQLSENQQPFSSTVEITVVCSLRRIPKVSKRSSSSSMQLISLAGQTMRQHMRRMRPQRRRFAQLRRPQSNANVIKVHKPVQIRWPEVMHPSFAHAADLCRTD